MPVTRTVTNRATKAVSSGETHPAPKDAIALLEADHAASRDLFAGAEKTHSVPDEKVPVADICTALSVHAQIAEEVVDSVVNAALKYKSLVPEATAEHAGVKDLIAQIEGPLADGEMVDAKVKLPSEFEMHLVEEAQYVVLPRVKASSTDRLAPGARLTVRKDELLAQAA